MTTERPVGLLRVLRAMTEPGEQAMDEATALEWLAALPGPDRPLREALTKHVWNNRTGKCGCGQTFDFHAQWVAHIAALPDPDRLDLEDGDWFRWRHAGQCAFERGEGQCDCGLSAQQQALSLALPSPDGLDGALTMHPDDGHIHIFGCRLCGVDPGPDGLDVAEAAADALRERLYRDLGLSTEHSMKAVDDAVDAFIAALP